jgi:tRNA(Ile2) C34 agmatinyltransferase TiaS
MLSEVVGNLEVLEDRGRVVRVAGAVPYRYRGAASALTDAGPGLAGGASGA